MLVMKLELKLLFCTICSIISFLLSFQLLTAQPTSKKEWNKVPPRIGKEASVLLVLLKNNTDINQLLSRSLKEHYKGEMKFLSEMLIKANLSKEDYSDRNTYRYLIEYEIDQEINSYEDRSGYQEGYVLSMYLSIKDRITDEKYYSRPLSISAYFLPSNKTLRRVKKYIQLMEETRLSRL